VNSSMIDVKELTPEFFFMPEFLENLNGFDLGKRQTGDVLGTVVLPPWASTPEDFIRINREALESDYVSLNLHKWIDLIFGYKQLAEEAIKADNVFYYLTYEGAIDLESISDPHERQAIRDQIDNFGQTPAQLLNRAHTERDPRDPTALPPSVERLNRSSFFSLLVARECPVSYVAISASTPPRVLILNEHLEVSLYSAVVVHGNPELHSEDPQVGGGDVLPHPRLVVAPITHDLAIGPGLFTITPDCRVLLTCGHWDNSFKLTVLDKVHHTRPVVSHSDVVTCLALTEDGRCLVTGSRDTTVCSFDLDWGEKGAKDGGSSGAGGLPTPRLRHIFYGHDDGITAVAANSEHDLLLSGSRDGTCVIHSLRTGAYVRTLRLSTGEVRSVPTQVCITSLGNIVVAASHGGEHELFLFGINGKRLKRILITRPLSQFVVTHDDRHIILGMESVIGVVSTHNLKSLFEVNLAPKVEGSAPIMVKSVTLSQDSRQVFAGLSNGKLIVITPEVMGAFVPQAPKPEAGAGGK